MRRLEKIAVEAVEKWGPSQRPGYLYSYEFSDGPSPDDLYPESNGGAVYSMDELRKVVHDILSQDWD